MKGEYCRYLDIAAAAVGRLPISQNAVRVSELQIRFVYTIPYYSTVRKISLFLSLFKITFFDKVKVLIDRTSAPDDLLGFIVRRPLRKVLTHTKFFASKYKSG